MGDQPKIQDYFDSNYDDQPDPDGSRPGPSVTTRSQSQSINSASQLIDAIIESADSLKTKRPSTSLKRLQNINKSTKGKTKRTRQTPAKNKSKAKPTSKPKSKLHPTTPESPVGEEPDSGTAGHTPGGPVGTDMLAPGTEDRNRTIEAPVDLVSGPDTEQMRAANPDGTQTDHSLLQIENEYLKHANDNLKSQNAKQKKKIKDLLNTIDELRKAGSRTRQMLEKDKKGPAQKPTSVPVTQSAPSSATTTPVADNPETRTRPVPKPRKTIWKKADIDISIEAQSDIHQKPKIMTIGSSLARGTKGALERKGIKTVECSYPGAQLPYIRKQLKRDLEENPQVDTVVIVGGGNDCEARHHIEDIKYEYDALVDEVKLTHGADTKIIISSVPQRKRASRLTHIKIAELNQHNASFYSGTEYGVTYVDAAPRLGHQFIDRVHLNYHGLDHWASKVSAALKLSTGQSI